MVTVAKNRYINRELTWLQFNARVLQEAEDESVPLIDRMRFLGIFSNNLDEFFKVRYATIKRIDEAGKSGTNQLGGITAAELLKKITKTVIKQQSESLEILKTIKQSLKKEKIFVINETEINPPQHHFIKDYFFKNVSPALVTIIVDEDTNLPYLKDSVAYLAVKMLSASGKKQFALVEIPRQNDRFIVLPKDGDKNYIIMLDDLIRYCLRDIFNIFYYYEISAHMIKITRDAELDLDSDLTKSFMEKISESVKHREIGDPVRFVYDKTIAEDTLEFFMSKMGIDSKDSVIPGGRYHNRRDYMKFPSLGRKDLMYKSIENLPVKGLSLHYSIFDAIATKDYLMYVPYHTFSYVVKFLREAAIDPQVKSIKITIYRLAQISHVASSLINAAINGKRVVVSMEIQARFDEQANIDYAEQMKEKGVHLIFGVPGLKVHSKMCVVEREEQGKLKRYGFLSTGNFNESTAKIYTDYILFTSHDGILKDVNKIFNFFEVNYKQYTYKHLIVSPFFTKSKFYKLIDQEIQNANQGKPAYIKLKMNSLSSLVMIDKLYEASRAGVKIKMIIRGICCLVPGVEGMSENIEVISVVDKFLEHTRMTIFCNDDDPVVHFSSADWMTRNVFNRVEVSCPIYDVDIKKELIDTFDISWKDNVKARIIDEHQQNNYKKDGKKPYRSQFEMYNYYRKQLGLTV